ncbi:MAG: cob(I)yrinic acid a,c-diamide adenosyltransferase [Anaerolineae bacterium]
MTEPIHPPSSRAYGRHVFICTHGNCAEPELGEGLHRRFGELNRQHALNKLSNPERVKCSLADCLGICSGGPVMVVYPEGIWYHHVDEAKLERIYREHVLGGRPVEEFIFHRLYPAGQEPGYAPEVRGEAGGRGGEGAEEQGSALCVPLAGAGEQINEITPAPPPPRTSAPRSEAETLRAAVRRAKKKKGLVIVNTGTGKGKTTAALGVMTRAWGRKMRIGVLQFLKNENARFGEIKAAEQMSGIDWISTGDGWSWTSQDMAETEARARHGWQIAQERIAGGHYDLLILDEFTYPLHYGWLDTGEVIAWLRANKPDMLHLIITGRYAPPALIEYADLVTEMRELKHPFREQGIRAQAGIEY